MEGLPWPSVKSSALWVLALCVLICCSNEAVGRVLTATRERSLLAAMTGDHRRTSFLCPERERKLAWTYHGDLGRIRQALDRHRQGKNLTVAVVGGSITAGAGAWDSHAWAEWLEDWLHERFPERLLFRNGAVPGTMSSYMSMCHNIHVPRDADVIIVEYALNDFEAFGPPFNNPTRRAYERLLRKLLNYPNKPAVVILNAFSYGMPLSNPGLFYTSAEREFYEFATYYHIPFISVKSAVYHLMLKGVHGFNVLQYRTDDQMRIRKEIDHLLKGDVFYSDVIHPEGWTGHLVMAELVEQMFIEVLEGLAAKPLNSMDFEDTNSKLPVPMIKGNWESISDKCFIGNMFRSTVVGSTGFEWKNDAPPGKKAKFGYISYTPGSTLQLRINTVAPSGPDVLVSVEVAFLKSYHLMGMAQVSCKQGCQCNTTIFDGHQTTKNSLLNLHQFMTSQTEECIIVVEVLPTSNSGGHKVKVAGIMVSEEGVPGKQGFGNHAAADYVSGALQSHNLFEIKNAVGE